MYVFWLDYEPFGPLNYADGPKRKACPLLPADGGLLHSGLCSSSQVYGFYLVCIKAESSDEKVQTTVDPAREHVASQTREATWIIQAPMPLSMDPPWQQHIASPRQRPYRGGVNKTPEMKVERGGVERCCRSGVVHDDDPV